MKTLVMALVGAVLLGLAFEGSVKIRGVLASCTFWRVGRVGMMAWAYRPGRVYVKLGVCNG